MLHFGANEGKTGREGHQEERPDDDKAGGEAEAERGQHACTHLQRRVCALEFGEGETLQAGLNRAALFPLGQN